ncbi:MAG: hypothetical protein WDM80_07275 [Limisphaerales bacterium]
MSSDHKNQSDHKVRTKQTAAWITQAKIQTEQDQTRMEQSLGASELSHCQLFGMVTDGFRHARNPCKCIFT